MPDGYDVLIVGAGHGGAQMGAALRQNGYQGTIGLIGDEPDLPYERPPLFKDYHTRNKPFERILIRPERFWKEKRIDLLLGRRVEAVWPAARTVSVESGTARSAMVRWSGRPAAHRDG